MYCGESNSSATGVVYDQSLLLTATLLVIIGSRLLAGTGPQIVFEHASPMAAGHLKTARVSPRPIATQLTLVPSSTRVHPPPTRAVDAVAANDVWLWGLQQRLGIPTLIERGTARWQVVTSPARSWCTTSMRMRVSSTTVGWGITSPARASNARSRWHGSAWTWW